jgi:hypothetical protein
VLLGSSWELLGTPGELLGGPGGGGSEKQEKSQAEKRPNTLRTKAETRFRKTRNDEKPNVVGDFGGGSGRQFATVASIPFGAPEATGGGTNKGPACS